MLNNTFYYSIHWNTNHWKLNESFHTPFCFQQRQIVYFLGTSSKNTAPRTTLQGGSFLYTYTYIHTYIYIYHGYIYTILSHLTAQKLVCFDMKRWDWQLAALAIRFWSLQRNNAPFASRLASLLITKRVLEKDLSCCPSHTESRHI